jgi:hypothetical protein
MQLLGMKVDYSDVHKWTSREFFYLDSQSLLPFQSLPGLLATHLCTVPASRSYITQAKLIIMKDAVDQNQLWRSYYVLLKCHDSECARFAGLDVLEMSPHQKHHES